VVRVEQRVDAVNPTSPKTEASRREVAIAEQTAVLLQDWMSAVSPEPNAFVFPGDTKGRSGETRLYDHIRPKLKPRGLEWVDFQAMRATHASIGHRLKDPKVTADQRGHVMGVAIE
jgi:integrase